MRRLFPGPRAIWASSLPVCGEVYRHAEETLNFKGIEEDTTFKCNIYLFFFYLSLL